MDSKTKMNTTVAQKMMMSEALPQLQNAQTLLGNAMGLLNKAYVEARADVGLKEQMKELIRNANEVFNACDGRIKDYTKSLKPENAFVYKVRRADVSKPVEVRVFVSKLRKTFTYKFTSKTTRRLNLNGDGYTQPKETLYDVDTPNGKHQIVSERDWSEIERALNRDPAFRVAPAVLESLNFAGMPDAKMIVPRIVAFQTYENKYGNGPAVYPIGSTWMGNPVPDTVQSVVVAEKWANWGGIWAMTSSGISKDTGLPITGLRATPEEPDDEDLKALRRARIELNENICAEAMKPARVERRIEEYGMDWMEQS